MESWVWMSFASFKLSQSQNKPNQSIYCPELNQIKDKNRSRSYAGSFCTPAAAYNCYVIVKENLTVLYISLAYQDPKEDALWHPLLDTPTATRTRASASGGQRSIH
jgi:hypothetical protein